MKKYLNQCAIKFFKKHNGILTIADMQTVAKFIEESTPTKYVDFSEIILQLETQIRNRIKEIFRERNINSFEFTDSMNSGIKPTFTFQGDDGPETFLIQKIILNVDELEIELVEDIYEETFTLDSNLNFYEMQYILFIIESN